MLQIEVIPPPTYPTISITSSLSVESPDTNVPTTTQETTVDQRREEAENKMQYLVPPPPQFSPFRNDVEEINSAVIHPNIPVISLPISYVQSDSDLCMEHRNGETTDVKIQNLASGVISTVNESLEKISEAGFNTRKDKLFSPRQLQQESEPVDSDSKVRRCSEREKKLFCCALVCFLCGVGGIIGAAVAKVKL